MAEIRVQEKRGSLAWLWVLLLLALAAVAAWWFLSGSDVDVRTEPAPAPAPAVSPTSDVSPPAELPAAGGTLVHVRA